MQIIVTFSVSFEFYLLLAVLSFWGSAQEGLIVMSFAKQRFSRQMKGMAKWMQLPIRTETVAISQCRVSLIFHLIFQGEFSRTTEYRPRNTCPQFCLRFMKRFNRTSDSIAD